MSARVVGSGLLLFAGFAAIAAAPAAALSFAVVYTDPANEGFNDATPYVGPGAAGQTLGGLRRAALRVAFDTWAAELTSEVPIVVEAGFEDLGCTAPITLAYAMPVAAVKGVGVPGGMADRAYPLALANRLAGVDLYPGTADIALVFSSAECFEPWSYGASMAGQDFVGVALHELAHGLGFVSAVDPLTGDWRWELPDPFSRNIISLLHDKRLHELSADERLEALGTPRNLVWGGPAVLAVIDQYLVPGAPTFWTEPALPGLLGHVADSNLGSRPLDQDIAGEVQVGATCLATATTAGRFYTRPSACPVSDLLQSVEAMGGLGVLDASAYAPPWPLDQPGAPVAAIPLLRLSSADFDLLETAAQSAPITAHVLFDSTQRTGADAEGRLYMHGGRLGTVVQDASHWDALARPDLLMEPGRDAYSGAALDLTVQALVDVGWNVCGDGIVTPPEGCDEGAANADVVGATCRTDCRVPGCGDAVLEGAEACDSGSANSDLEPDACRTDCSLPACGDGVVDSDERCDDGIGNSNQTPGGCRLDCSYCGDGVLVAGEDCDQGTANGDFPGAPCRTDCTLPRCGDAVRENGEPCDWGSANSDTEPDACRTDCTVPACGDGVTDADEECDSGDGLAARVACVDCLLVEATVAVEPAPDAGEPNAAPRGRAQGCGCRVGRGASGTTQPVAWALAGLWLVVRSRRRRRP